MSDDPTGRRGRMSGVSRPLALRSLGYVTLCSGLHALLLGLSVGAFSDRSLVGARDADWMFWAWAAVLVALLIRAPFVGLLIRDDRVIRRSWIRSRSWPRSEIVDVDRAGYSGLLNRASISGRFKMVTLYTRDRSIIKVPELTGGVRTTERYLAHLHDALGRPLGAQTPGRHRS
jgi:uncharacterized membrane protein YcjF (UPF0283 family)